MFPFVDVRKRTMRCTLQCTLCKLSLLGSGFATLAFSQSRREAKAYLRYGVREVVAYQAKPVGVRYSFSRAICLCERLDVSP